MRYSNLLPRLALMALVVPVAGFCTSLQVSSSGGSTVCVSGTCPDPNSTSTAVGISPSSGTVSGSYSYTYSLTDKDTYSITAGYSASYTTGVVIFFNPTVTYTGNNGSSSVAAVAADNISLDLYQNYYDSTPGSWSGSYCEYFPTSLPAGATATANLTYDGGSTNPQSVGTISGVSGTTTSKCSTLTFNSTQNASAYLNADYNIAFNFAAGTTAGTPGSSTSTTVAPEPSTMAMGVLGCGSLLYFARRRRSSN